MMLLQNPSKYREKKKQAMHHRSGARGAKLLEICSRSASEGGWSYMIVCEIYLPRSRYGDKQVQKARV